MGHGTEIRNLLTKRRELERTAFHSDPERRDAEHRWLMEAITLLLTERDHATNAS